MTGVRYNSLLWMCTLKPPPQKKKKKKKEKKEKEVFTSITLDSINYYYITNCYINMSICMFY